MGNLLRHALCGAPCVFAVIILLPPFPRSTTSCRASLYSVIQTELGRLEVHEVDFEVERCLPVGWFNIPPTFEAVWVDGHRSRKGGTLKTTRVLEGGMSYD